MLNLRTTIHLFLLLNFFRLCFVEICCIKCVGLEIINIKSIVVEPHRLRPQHSNSHWKPIYTHYTQNKRINNKNVFFSLLRSNIFFTFSIRFSFSFGLSHFGIPTIWIKSNWLNNNNNVFFVVAILCRIIIRWNL